MKEQGKVAGLSKEPEKNKFKNIKLNDLLKEFAQNPVATDVARWLRQTGEDFSHYPMQQELDEKKLTPLSWAALTGRIRSFPGGMASPLAVLILMEDIKRQHKENPEKPIVVFAMLHGAIMPNVPRVDDVETLNERTKTCKTGEFHRHNAFARAEIGNDAHSEMCCAGGNGNSLNTRELSDKNIKELKKLAEEQGIGVTIIPIEAIVPVHSNTPMFRVYEKTPLESEDNYLASEKNDLCQYPVEKLMTPEKLNTDVIQKYWDEGYATTGIICSDYRNGALLPHENIETIDIDALGKELNKGLISVVRTERTDWAGCRHAESYGLPIIGDDEEMMAIAYASVTHAFAKVMSVDSGASLYVTQSRPFLINIPEYIFGKYPREIQSILQKLVSTLDTHGLRRKIGREVRDFVKRDGKLEEIDTEPGFQIIVPREKEEFFGQIKPGFLITSYIGINPSIKPEDSKDTAFLYYRTPGSIQGKRTWLGTKRKLGPTLEEILKS